MRQGKAAGIKFLPGGHRLCEAILARGAQMPGLRILADRQNHLDLRHQFEQGCPPAWRTFAARRQVAALRIEPRKAEAHRHDGDARDIVELLRRHAHPIAQPVAARVREGRARGMNACAGRLACNTDACGLQNAKDRARLMPQRPALRAIHAEAAGTDIGGEAVERRHGLIVPCRGLQASMGIAISRIAVPCVSAAAHMP